MLNKSRNNKTFVYSKFQHGHRSSYLDFVSTTFAAKRVGLREALLTPGTVVFLMIEESFMTYCIAVVLRAILLRKTVGLLFSPLIAIEAKSVRFVLKRWILTFMKRLKLARTLTILPFDLDARLSTIASGWLYDFQLWDLSVAIHHRYRQDQAGESQSEFSKTVKILAQGKKVVVALGAQHRAKGFDRFLDLCLSSPHLREKYCFMFAGKADSSFSRKIEEFKQVGGVAIDRFVTDEELVSCYAISDLVWCCYSPNYDQASGIFGRAVQFNKTVIVREGSLLHRFCEKEDIQCIALGASHDVDLCKPCEEEEEMLRIARIERFRTWSCLIWGSFESKCTASELENRLSMPN